jgi:chemotaxis signal transduction protein
MKDHCHIYNIHSYAQIQLLEQFSDQEFREYAQSLATQQDAPLVTHEEALECHDEQIRYLLPLRALREVVSAPHKLTLLPLSPPWMLGITLWRGHVIPVINLAAYFSAHAMHEQDAASTLQQAYSHANSTLLVLDDADTLLGIQVAVAESITTLEQTQLASPEQAPSWYPRRLLTTLLGVYNGSVILNPQVLVAEMVQQIRVSATYE